MPLREAPIDSDVGDGKERFLIFFSSRLPENNSLWCPDCAAVEASINKTFGSELAPSALLVYVGQRSEWKTPNNIFRQEPWKVASIPTIIKLDDSGKEVGRLVDGRNLISEELSSFVL